jgi:hypothetical protein
VSLGSLFKSRSVTLIALASVSLLSSAAPALGAWSGASQVVGYSEGKNVVASIDDDGTQQLGFLAPSVGLFSLTRPAGSTGSATWTAKNVSGAINNGHFAFAGNGAAVATWKGLGNSVLAAYRPAGKAWGSAVTFETPPKLGEDPIPTISDKGDAAVVWSRKSDIDLREPDEIRYAATSNGTWSAAATLAEIEVAQPVNEDDFLSCLAGSGMDAAMLPNGDPIVAWNDPYGSFKQTVTTPPGDNELGICGVQVATPGSGPKAIAPATRPSIGWGVTPSGELPFWLPVSLEVDPVSGRTALIVRGSADSVTTSCGAQEVDYCFDSSGGFETRVSLGTGTTIPHPGTLTASLAGVALRNGFVAAATGSGTAALTGGVSTGFPTLAALSPNALLTVSSLAVGSKGEAELLVHNGTKLIAYSAAAGGQFGPAADIQTGSQGGVSVAIGCNGDSLAGWNRGTNGLFAATDITGAAQCDGEEGGEETPPVENPSTPGSVAPSSSGGSSSTTTPSAPVIAKKSLKCKKGFKKKTVRGKPKCVKKPKKGKKKR